MENHTKNTILGVYGGTFDPIHNGHIQPVLEAAAVIGVQEIRIVPCHIPPHKASPSISSKIRLEMIEVLCNQYGILRADSREMRREKPSYSFDTLVDFRNEYPTRPICFFMGMDSFIGLTHWYRWMDLFGLCHIVVCRRPGQDDAIPAALQAEVESRQTRRPDELSHHLYGKIFFAPTSELSISSSYLREQLSLGKSCSGLLPDDIARYIERNKLYQ